MDGFIVFDFLWIGIPCSHCPVTARIHRGLLVRDRRRGDSRRGGGGFGGCWVVAAVVVGSCGGWCVGVH